MSLTDIELPSEYLRRCTLAWFMAKTFCPRDLDQSWVLPLSMHEFVPPGHLAHFIRETVREAEYRLEASGFWSGVRFVQD
jgi:hypothetical protein